MGGLLCGVPFGRAIAGAVGDQYGWRAMFRLGCLLAVVTGILLSATPPNSSPKSRDSYPQLLWSLVTLFTLAKRIIFGWSLL